MPGLSCSPPRRHRGHTFRAPGRLALVAAAAAVALAPAAPGGATPEPELPVITSPFTGEPAAQNPVLAVKLDNAPAARPHLGLREADLVHVAEVEGGLNRLTAVYSSGLPEVVGPVRSARESDLELLPTFGEPALAFSGARSELLPDIERAPVHGVTPESADDAFHRDTERPAPHDLLLDPARALAEAPGATLPRDVGFRFGPAPEGGTEQESRTVTYPASSLTFDWSPDRAEWLVSMDGEPARDAAGEQLGAATVVVQRTEVRESRFPGTPHVPTVGSGAAEVLRDGRSFPARWERTDPDHGTSFTDDDGWLVPFDTGQVWIVHEDATA